MDTHITYSNEKQIKAELMEEFGVTKSEVNSAVGRAKFSDSTAYPSVDQVRSQIHKLLERKASKV